MSSKLLNDNQIELMLNEIRQRPDEIPVHRSVIRELLMDRKHRIQQQNEVNHEDLRTLKAQAAAARAAATTTQPNLLLRLVGGRRLRDLAAENTELACQLDILKTQQHKLRSQYNQKLQSANARAGTLERELHEANTALEDARVQIDQMQALSQQQLQQLDALNSAGGLETEALEQQIQTLESALEGAEARLAETQRTADRYQAELMHAEAEKAGLSEELNAFRAETEKLRDDQGLVSDLREQIDQLKQRAAEEQAHAETYTNSLNAILNACQDAVAPLEEESTLIEDLPSLITRRVETIGQLETSLAAQADAVKMVAAERDALAEKNQHLLHRLKETVESLKVVAHERKRLREEYGQALVEQRELQHHNRSLRSEMSAHIEHIHALQEQLSDKDGVIAGLHQDHESLVDQKIALEAELSEAREALNNLEQAQQQSQATIEELRQSAARQDSELEAEIVKLHEILKEKDESLLFHAIQDADHEQQISTLSHQLDEKTTLLDTAQEKLTQTRSELSVQTERNNKLLDRADRLRAALHSQHEKAKHYANRAGRLERELHQTQQRLATLNTNLRGYLDLDAMKEGSDMDHLEELTDALKERVDAMAEYEKKIMQAYNAINTLVSERPEIRESLGNDLPLDDEGNIVAFPGAMSAS